MKRCPKCNADYFDNMLEFCLEDGARLLFASGEGTTATKRQQTPTTIPQAGPLSANSTLDSTVVMRQPGEVETVVTTIANDQLPQAGEQSQTTRIMETAPIILALAHNWWQWLYIEKSYISSITDFVLSANFLMWLLLLASGAAVSFFAVKHSKNKTLGIIALVVLAINLILFLVPRR